MKNFLRADFHRIMTKRIRILMMILLALADIIYMFLTVSSDKNIIEMTNRVGCLDFIYGNIIMLLNILISYGDDMRAKSMQAALGYGMKRQQIVFAKWINLALMIILDMLFLTVVQFIPLIITGKLAGTFVVGQVIVSQISLVFVSIISITLAMIVLFQTQKAVLGVLVYIYLSMGGTSSIISIAVMNKFVQKFQLWNIGAADQMNIFISKLWLGQFDIRNFLMVALYFAIGFGVTIYLFRKKELDF